ncbi:hypothetical protein Plec18170_003101 [Paecilomyces lecythidis]
MPETAFQRDIAWSEQETNDKAPTVYEEENVQVVNTRKKTFIQRIAFRRSPLTHEPIWKIALRPVIVVLIPAVLWSTIAFGIGIGIFVVVSTTAATAYTQVYHFTTWQVGLVWIASIIGNILGMPFGGYFSDWVANRATSKNGGIREPEMRLPAVSIAMLCYPASLLLYGMGINYQVHWMVPTLGIFLSIVTFLMSFYANPWIQKDGYAGAFGIMAGFSFFILALWIPLYILGKKIRHATLKWRIMRLAHWDSDREIGE